MLSWRSHSILTNAAGGVDFARGKECLGPMQTLAAEPTYEATPARTATVLPSTWVVVVGGTSILIGILWDISWHRTIGRDTFWTPAHMAIYLGGILGGLTCGWLVIHATFFATPEEQAGSVRLWGFR